MTDQVLTEDEKSALLDGISTGAVEVQSSGGPQYAELREFEVAPRSRIQTDSFPRLQLLNHQFAERMGWRAEQLLNCDIDVSSSIHNLCPLGEIRDQLKEPSLVMEFQAPPLTGTGLIYVEAELVGHLVESFFGGNAVPSSRQVQTSFTPGEKSVSNLFVNEVLSTVKEVWESMIEFAPERNRTGLGSDIIDGVDATDAVISTRFELSMPEHQGMFLVVWPVAMVSSLVPVFEGQKRERDAAEDARWEKSLRARVVDTVVSISSHVGNASLALGDLVGLTPGTVIEIDNPQKATVFAKKVPILEGRFGVHDGCNAVETTAWLNAGLPATS